MIQLASYPSYILVVGLWGGPYLTHIYGYDLKGRGDILFVAALAQIVGSFFWGPADRLFGRHKIPIMLSRARPLRPIGRSRTVAAHSTDAITTVAATACSEPSSRQGRITGSSTKSHLRTTWLCHRCNAVAAKRSRSCRRKTGARAKSRSRVRPACLDRAEVGSRPLHHKSDLSRRSVGRQGRFQHSNHLQAKLRPLAVC